MKRWRDWAFVALLIALAAIGGWVKERQGASLAEAGNSANQG